MQKGEPSVPNIRRTPRNRHDAFSKGREWEEWAESDVFRFGSPLRLLKMSLAVMYRPEKLKLIRLADLLGPNRPSNGWMIF